MKNTIKEIDMLLKDKNITPDFREILKKKKEALKNNKNILK